MKQKSVSLSLIFVVGCASLTSQDENSAQLKVVRLIVAHTTKDETPVGGSYSEGARLFQEGNPEAEARAEFKTSGLTILTAIDSYIVLGVPPETERKVWDLFKSGQLKPLTVPGVPHVVPTGSEQYRRAAGLFLSRFNVEMIRLWNLSGKGPKL